jgi:hypothetical protein
MVKAPQVRRTERASQTKIGHVIHVRHRDQVEAPITDWLREAYEHSDTLSVRPAKTRRKPKPRAAPRTKKAAKRARSTQKKTRSSRR